MASVIETYNEKRMALQAELHKVEMEISQIPSEFHALEIELWTKIKEWFGGNPNSALVLPAVPPTEPPPAV
jgi:hypothetical protein